jgi:hypothetical protein
MQRCSTSPIHEHVILQWRETEGFKCNRALHLIYRRCRKRLMCYSNILQRDTLWHCILLLTLQPNLLPVTSGLRGKWEKWHRPRNDGNWGQALEQSTFCPFCFKGKILCTLIWFAQGLPLLALATLHPHLAKTSILKTEAGGSSMYQTRCVTSWEVSTVRASNLTVLCATTWRSRTPSDSHFGFVMEPGCDKHQGLFSHLNNIFWKESCRTALLYSHRLLLWPRCCCVNTSFVKQQWASIKITGLLHSVHCPVF